MPASERIHTFWKSASPLKRAVAVALPAIILALAAGGITFAAVSGGDDDGGETAVAPTPTRSGPTATPQPPTPTVEEVLRYFAAILPTATATPQFTGGSAPATGGGGGGRPAAPRAGLTGPGPIVSSDIRLQIPRLGMNTAVNARSVGTNGQMGDPIGPWMVLWYDFRPFGGHVGGYPGEPGANVVMAGHVDYINVGPAVFYGLSSLQPGDLITVTGANGPITYSVHWSRMVSPGEDFTQYVQKYAHDTVTLVTCIGAFSAGHYSSRLVVHGVRI